MLKWIIFATVFLIILKLLGFIQWPWMVAFAPILSWIAIILFTIVGVCLLVGGIALIIAFITKVRKY